MKSVLRLTLLVFLTATVCFGQSLSAVPDNQAKDEGEIRKLTRLWDKAMVDRDIVFLDGVLADDYIISGRTKSRYLELMKSSEIKYTSFDREVLSFRVYGSAALVLSQTNVNGQSSSNGWFSSSFSFMDVWIKHQGRWRCVATKAEEIVQTYEKQEIVKFGPKVKANLVIVFKSDVTNDQVEEFRRNVLQIAKSNELERGYFPGVRQYLRSLPIQRHEAVALTFHSGITAVQRDEVVARIRSSPLVYKVFEDIAPTNVKLDQ